ncbi:protein BREAKING OF ASYMMETRY IN THE STOMATAL LINEAGE [Eucalyptus grandis]|uniref:protein BREAKING OF ASYMMETRY IN THE STOMATAL LINEAGE n=1 Tax=Eucalyptus grandis TaxID=71139 RepID=UPI00192EF33E|nr:protein BREAKING OF ASYMMETRY IN THE STOMATAL LINEAGE [Eucalyptus grandis]
MQHGLSNPTSSPYMYIKSEGSWSGVADIFSRFRRREKRDMGVDQRDESRSSTTAKKRSCDAMAKIGSGCATATMARKTGRKILPEDEDYIEFCFREDGAFHVIKDNQDKSSASASASASAQLDGVNSTAPIPRPVDRKLDHSKIETVRNEVVEHSRSKDEGNGSRGNGQCTSSNKKEKKGGVSRAGKETTERTDSTKSDGSGRGSFSFPALRVEWTGSPVQMPRPAAKEGLPYLKKQRVPRVRVRFQCCRF